MLELILWTGKFAPDVSEDVLHQPLGNIIDAFGESGVLWTFGAFLLCLVVAYVTRDFGKPAKRRPSDPPLCSAYPSHPPENCVDDPPLSMAVRLRRPYFAALWVVGLVLAMVAGWRTHVVLARGWTPVIGFDVGAYDEKLRAQCPAANGWLRDLSFEIDRRGCINLPGCVRMTAIQRRCSMAPPVGSEQSEVAIEQAFATQPECQDVRLVSYIDKEDVAAIERSSNLTYALSLQPSWTDDDKRVWKITRSGRSIHGVDDVGGMASEICRLVKNWN